MLDTEADSGSPALSQQWRIASNHDGYFQIASNNPGSGNVTNALDDPGAATAAGTAIVQSAANGSSEQEWTIVSAAGGYFNLMNRVSGMVLDTNGGSGAQAGFVVQEPSDSGAQTQQWQIVPVR